VYIIQELGSTITCHKILRTGQMMLLKFKQALKKFLLVGSFYSLNEFFEWKTKSELGSYK
jgi:hypothetical protein